MFKFYNLQIGEMKRIWRLLALLTAVVQIEKDELSRLFYHEKRSQTENNKVNSEGKHFVDPFEKKNWMDFALEVCKKLLWSLREKHEKYKSLKNPIFTDTG